MDRGTGSTKHALLAFAVLKQAYHERETEQENPQIGVMEMALWRRRYLLGVFWAVVSLSAIVPRVRSQAVIVDPPEIVTLVADDPTNADIVYGDGDTITITFNVNTDRAGLAIGVAQSETIVDNLFIFSQFLGSERTGMWTSARVFVVTIVDWSGAAPPVVGPQGLIVTANSGASRGIRADANTVGQSITSSSVSPRLSGDFGPECISFVSITAVNPSGFGDEYKAGDKIVVRFNLPTNRGFTTLTGSTALSKAQLDTLFSFSQSLGRNYTGQWDSTQQLTITVGDTTNSGPPSVESFTMQCRAAGELRNSPPACAPSTAVSDVLQGNWGPCELTITSLTAADPQNIDMSFS
eukprot:519009-Rhodomonas_salina.1